MRIWWLELAGNWMLARGTYWIDTAWFLRERRGNAQDVELQSLMRQGWDKAMDRLDETS
jgi:hypothetical protein